jgi:hypothetical protein
MAQSFCKVELDSCDETGNIWVFVKQKLGAMRVDACTNEIKECFASETACGADFSKCIGMDLEAIIQICPADKLVVCKKDNPDFSFYDVSNMAMGIMLNMDTKLMNKCMEIVEAKMIEVCGDTKSCAPPFQEYNKSHFKSSVDFGAIALSDGAEWAKCKNKNADNSCAKFPQGGALLTDKYLESKKKILKTELEKIKGDLESANEKINMVISLVEDDPKVSWCVKGRDLKQAGGTSTSARYPTLTQGLRRVITEAGLEQFRK